MTDEFWLRLEAKIDALLGKAGIEPKSVSVATTPSPKPAPLTAAEQQALNNAPATPAADVPPPPEPAPENAPKTPAPTEGEQEPSVVPRRRPGQDAGN
jgi:hypothetical protein